MKLHYPAADRNASAILEALREVLPASGTVLEVASGPGQHAAFMAAALPHLRWQPSDVAPDALASIRGYRSEHDLPNLLDPLQLDASRPPWPIAFDAVVCINMIHISPWDAAVGLVQGAAAGLAPTAPLVLYGPFSIDGDYTSQSNIDFDRSLRERNAAWGVRELRDVERLAEQHALALDQVIPRPANNHVVVFRKHAR